MDSLESDKPGDGVGIEGISVRDIDAGEIAMTDRWRSTVCLLPV